MARKCLVYRDKKKLELATKSFEKRQLHKAKIKDLNVPMNEKIEHMKLLNKMPKNGSKSRVNNRCQQCGRSRGYYRKFGLCRICLRKAMMLGYVPGLKKASW